MDSILFTIDQLLAAAALLIVIAYLVARAARPGRDVFNRCPNRPNKFREDSIALIVVFYLLAVMMFSGVMGILGKPPASLLSILVTGNGGHFLGIVACLMIASRQFEGGLRRFLLRRRRPGARSWRPVVLLSTLVTIGLCPIITEVTMRVVVWFLPGYEFSPHPTIEALRAENQPIGMMIVLWAGAVVIAPVAEELFFRGFVQTWLVGVLRSRWRAILVTSLVFGLIHISQPYAIAALIFLAVVIGYTYERTGSMLPPILIHAAFNLKTLIWEALGDWPM